MKWQNLGLWIFKESLPCLGSETSLWLANWRMTLSAQTTFISYSNIRWRKTREMEVYFWRDTDIHTISRCCRCLHSKSFNFLFLHSCFIIFQKRKQRRLDSVNEYIFKVYDQDMRVIGLLTVKVKCKTIYVMWINNRKSLYKSRLFLYSHLHV